MKLDKVKKHPDSSKFSISMMFKVNKDVKTYYIILIISHMIT